MKINKLTRTTYFYFTLAILNATGLLAFPAVLLAATITQSDCITFDHRDKVGPVRNQGKNGQCWAFAGTAALEEVYCESDPTLCGKSLSPLDASRCQWTVGKEDQGGLTRWAQNCALQNGVCLEKDAPYSNETDSNFNCTKPNAPLGDSPEDKIAWENSNCATAELQNELDQAKAGLLHGSYCPIKGSAPTLADGAIGVAPFLNAFKIADEFQCKEKDYLLPPQALALKEHLITDECKENRLALPNAALLKPISHVFPGGIDNIQQTSNRDKFLNMAHDMESQKHIVTLSVCVNKISPELAKHFTPDERGCAGHALAVDAVQWNPEKHECQVHVKNSWGEDAPLQGWTDADTVMGATFEYTQIKNKDRLDVHQ